jgi:putative Ca2+/H+ antiporter (TMEM165/GDT1 family)
MDWHLLGSSFVVIFLAELGDKTQLATFGLAAGSESRILIFLGASAALVATSAIAVLLGEAVTHLIPALWIKRAAGVAFLLVGCVYLLGRG